MIDALLRLLLYLLLDMRVGVGHQLSRWCNKLLQDCALHIHELEHFDVRLRFEQRDRAKINQSSFFFLSDQSVSSSANEYRFSNYAMDC